MKNAMKHRLQIHFILLSLCALVILQTLIVSFSIIRSYRQMTSKADGLILLTNRSPDSPEVSDARYFKVKYDLKTKRTETDLSHTSLMKQITAMAYAKQVLSQEADKGYLDGYRYLVHREKDSIHITFLARSVALQAFKSNAESLILLSCAGIGAMTIFLIAISGKVVSPLVRNHQKQKEFISSASHELKTPLTVIYADAQLLESEIGENDWLTDIQKQINHMTEMTHKLVYLSRLEEQEGNLVMIDFPISDVAEDITHSYNAIAQTSCKEYEVQIQQGLSYHGDEKAIQELMTVLLDNAFKYSSNDGRISAGLTSVGRSIHFTVENTVKNLDKSDLSQFTERFYRGKTSEHVKGFGIGLSIARAVAKAHKGSLIVCMPKKQTIRFTAVLK